jgi:beta-glucosidase
MFDIKTAKKGPFPPCAEVSREAAREGFVLLKNNNVLPLKKGETITVFGRDQLNYYKSGTGSGGLVHTDKILSIPEAIINDKDISLNIDVYNIYKEWEKENPFDEGKGWATEPWF